MLLPFLARFPWSICEKIAMRFAAMVHIFDLEKQRNLAVSGSLGERLGYTREEMRTMGVLALATLLHPSDLSLVAEYFQRFSELKSGEILEIQYRMRRADGTWCRLRSRETPYLRSTGNSSPQLLGIVEEINESETEPGTIEKTVPKILFSIDRSHCWIEILTREPDGIYHLGPFESRPEAELLYHRYLRGLQDDGDGKITVTIKDSQIPGRPPLKVVPRKSEPYRPD